MNLSAEDVEVIVCGLRIYLRERRKGFHHAAAETTEEGALKLSLDYQADRTYIEGLIQRVAGSKMEDSAGTSPEPVTKGSSDE